MSQAPAPWLADPDVTVYQGDALTVLRDLPDASVDCIVTSPPYWGLRDYGVDGQLGLESSPDEFVAGLVAVFREARRVLADHGTCWLNLGDSYARVGGDGGHGPNAQVGNTKSLKQRRMMKLPEAALDGQGRATHEPESAEAWRVASGVIKEKDLVGIPWRVAFALQADGWYLRSDIVWAKPNPMPESVTDRPTKAHEYVFLLTKQPRYWFDQEAVREEHGGRGSGNRERKANPAAALGNGDTKHGIPWRPAAAADPRVLTLGDIPPESPRGPDGRRKTSVQGAEGSIQHRDGERWPNNGRNIRSVWTIATQPYPEAHFATFPEELPRRAIRAGCPERVCRTCGKPSERIIEATAPDGRSAVMKGGKAYDEHGNPLMGDTMIDHGARGSWNSGGLTLARETVGWSDCGHDDWRPGVVMDPFAGSGTTLKVARDHARHAVGIELNPDYCDLIARRTQQQSLLAGDAA